VDAVYPKWQQVIPTKNDHHVDLDMTKTEAWADFKKNLEKAARLSHEKTRAVYSVSDKLYFYNDQKFEGFVKLNFVSLFPEIRELNVQFLSDIFKLYEKTKVRVSCMKGRSLSAIIFENKDRVCLLMPIRILEDERVEAVGVDAYGKDGWKQLQEQERKEAEAREAAKAEALQKKILAPEKEAAEEKAKAAKPEPKNA